jgi:hypothetical protein
MLKLGVQLHITPALSKACHPHIYKEHQRLNAVVYIIFQPIEQQHLRPFHSRTEIYYLKRSVQTGKFGGIRDDLVLSAFRTD